MLYEVITYRAWFAAAVTRWQNDSAALGDVKLLNWLLARLAAAYVEGIRNVPLLVQLFFCVITSYSIQYTK